MDDMKERIEFLEENVKGLKKELRRINSTINKVEKLGLTVPNELIYKKDDVEDYLKDYKKELKTLKKVVELIK